MKCSFSCYTNNNGFVLFINLVDDGSSSSVCGRVWLVWHFLHKTKTSGDHDEGPDCKTTQPRPLNNVIEKENVFY